MIFSKSEYRTEIEELRNCEHVISVEFVVRILVIAAGVIVGSSLLDMWALVPWFFTYYGLISIEKLVLHRLSDNTSRSAFSILLVLNFCIASVFAFMPVYLWYSPEPVFKFGSLAMLVGATLNAFVIRARVWQVLVCYLVPTGSSFIVISLSYYFESGLSAEFISTFIVGCGLTTYLILAGGESYSAHKKHEETIARLHQAQKMEAIGNLTGGIAHDFNNLLSVIMGNLELLRNNSDGNQADGELIERALHATQRGARLTGQMLAYGRRSDLAPELLNVNDILTSSRYMVQRVLPASIHFVVKASTDDWLVLADQSKLETALLNLAINARDAMPEGGTLTISAQRLNVTDIVPTMNGKLGYGNYIEIIVSDTGHGIDKNIQTQVFEPFFTTKPLDQGSGLGLSMVLGFVEQSGGSLQLESTSSKGTQVHLYLPAKIRKTPISTVKLPRRESSNKQLKILVVEDEPDLLELIVLHLESVGHTVAAASSANSALQIIRDGYIPQIVLTDIVMPGRIQGPELAEIATTLAPQSVFLFMTGYSGNTDVGGTSAYAREPVLQKPFSMEELSKRIAEKAA